MPLNVQIMEKMILQSNNSCVNHLKVLIIMLGHKVSAQEKFLEVDFIEKIMKRLDVNMTS
jgi:hypothetical protein